MTLAKESVHVFIVSDGTGLTAERVISAVLIQFKPIKPIFKRFPYIKTNEQIERILAKAESLEAIVIYSLVAKELRSWMNVQKRKRDVHAIDLLGPLLNRVGRLLNMMPDLVPGLLPGLGEESIRLAESIDFTLRHDDGQGIESLGKADLIIVGVQDFKDPHQSLSLM